MTALRFALWTEELKRWFLKQFKAIAEAIQNINFKPIEDKLDAITPYLYPECSDEDIDRMFESVAGGNRIIIPSEVITQEGSMPVSVFTAITGLTPTE